MATNVAKKAAKFFGKKKSKSKTKDAKKLLRGKKKSTDNRPEWAKGMSDSEYKDMLGFPREGKADEFEPYMTIHRKKGGVLKDVPEDNVGLSKLPTPVRNKMGFKKQGGKVGKPLGCGVAQRGFSRGPYKKRGM
tara:strand:- start:69 stop:470 length:402 start_codon:yes stop_codon:yes gene_type:complete